MTLIFQIISKLIRYYTYIYYMIMIFKVYIYLLKTLFKDKK